MTQAGLAPGVAALLQQIEAAGARPLRQGTVSAARAVPSLMRLVGKPPALQRNESFVIPSPHGGVAAQLHVPCGRPRGLLLYLHGGGWTLGSAQDWSAFTATLALRTNCAVLSLDYRLAPEHPFPAGLQDAQAAVEWTATHGRAALGLDGEAMLGVAGDSAGANLATVALRRHHARPDATRFHLQVLIYPVTDCDFETPSYRAFGEGLLLAGDDMRWFWNQYQRDTSARSHADLSPLHASDLNVLPSTLVLSASHDPLRDEGERYAQAMRKAGVPVELHRCEGLVHGFLALVTRVPEAAGALARITDFVEARATSAHG